MILDKLSVFKKLWPGRPDAAHETATRWTRAAQADPELVADVLRIGGVMAPYPRVYAENGTEILDPIDQTRLAIDAGRRELAVDLLALMTADILELQHIVENDK